MFHQLGQNDAALLPSLLFFCVDLWISWDSFSGCSKPVHAWLFASCSCAIFFRVTRLLAWAMPVGETPTGAAGGARPIGGRLGELLLDDHHKGFMFRALSAFTWGVAVPFFTLWTFVGTFWLRQVLVETPECIQSDTYLYFSCMWLLLSYYWMVVHAALCAKAWLLKCRVHRAEADLREIGVDADTMQRWGQVGITSGTLVDAIAPGKGLSPSQIRALPCESASSMQHLLMEGQCECSICITGVQSSDTVRRLPRCGHVFHKSCIDLWLVRQADCPLCKQDVIVQR